MEKLLWQKKKKTGDIKYYLLYNEYRGINNENDSGRNYSK